MSIKENLEKIKEQIGNNNVKIIAVTKYAGDDQILEAYKLGINDFGESYVQNALRKISDKCINFNNVNWHFIGRLQKNKVKFVVGRFFLVHSTDSKELATLINKTALKLNHIQNILLQVNISQEASKTGFSEEELKDSFGELVQLSNVKILGLMTIAPKTSEGDILRSTFLKLRAIKDELNKKHLAKANMNELSMGMTGDYKIALECGSTMIRIGRALFNEGYNKEA